MQTRRYQPAGWCKGHGRKRNEVGQRILSGAAVPRQGSSAFVRMASILMTLNKCQMLFTIGNVSLSLPGRPLKMTVRAAESTVLFF